MRSALLAIVAPPHEGAADGPLGSGGALVSTSGTAPVMFVSVRRSEQEDGVERARRNERSPPPIDAESHARGQATLTHAPETRVGIGNPQPLLTEERERGCVKCSLVSAPTRESDT